MEEVSFIKLRNATAGPHTVSTFQDADGICPSITWNAFETKTVKSSALKNPNLWESMRRCIIQRVEED